MRGLLSITSGRSPYQRAGLSWPAREPVEIHVGLLDVDRLRQLLADPVLTVRINDGAGNYHLVPTPSPDIADSYLQALIDADPVAEPSGAEADADADLRKLLDDTTVLLGAANAEIERLRQVEAAWQADQRHLFDQGYQTLDALTDAWAADRTALAAAQARVAELEAATAAKGAARAKAKAADA